MVIAVGIAAILLVAGGVWMLSLRPGALRGAVNDFDSALAVARQLAATSGNGATLAFVPRTDGAQGFVLRVYSGRPNSANAVTATNTMAVSSNATVSEATYGSPPFAIFLSSAGYPTGKASYPSIDASGNATFPLVAKQPPCPNGGIVLTFKSPQGATQTRSLKCNVVVTGVAVANPSPTPNPPHIVPQFMLAHWTSDTNPLQFKVAEIGYSHWFASTTGADCQTQGSDNGSAPASFPLGWPYSSPLTPGETSLAPSAPALPYSWPNGNVDDPAAAFHMQPAVGGECTVRMVDDYNQEVDAQVQVMGNLTSDTASLTFNTPTAPAQVITLSKTWDAEPLQLQFGGACGGVINVSKGGVITPSSAGTPPAKAQLNVAPASAGSCTLIVGDQYGEPVVSIPINVKNAPLQTLSQVEFVSSVVAYASSPFDMAWLINRLLGGSIAQASTSPCNYAGQLNAQLWVYDTNGNPNNLDASAPNSLDPYNNTDLNGCVINGTVYLSAQESGLTSNDEFGASNQSCGTYVSLTSLAWYVGTTPTTITPLVTTTGCIFKAISTDKTVANGGAKNVDAIVDSGFCGRSYRVLVNGQCYDIIAWRIYCPGPNSFGVVPPCYYPDGTQVPTTQIDGYMDFVYLPAKLESVDVQYANGGQYDCAGFCPGCPWISWTGGPVSATEFAWENLVSDTITPVANAAGIPSSDSSIAVALANAYNVDNGPPQPLNPLWAPDTTVPVGHSCKPSKGSNPPGN